jgi:hypothetical protein
VDVKDIELRAFGSTSSLMFFPSRVTAGAHDEHFCELEAIS